MADVSGRMDAEVADHDRGQLFLIGALALAVTFVVLALVMNGVIYTENVSARDLGTSTTPAIEFEEEARDVADHLLSSERGGADYDEITTNVTRGMTNWSNTTQPFGSVQGRLATIEDPSASNGTALEQGNHTRNFTDKDAEESWGLASDVNTREAWINATPSVEEDDVESEDFDDLTNDTGPFYLNVTDGSRTDTVFLYENSSGDACVAVFEDRNHENDTCVSGDDARVDLVSGTIEGVSSGDEDELGELRVLERVGEGHDLEFGNGDGATGTYHFVVDAERSAVGSGFHAGSGADSPRAVRALYDLEFRLEYRTANVHYDVAVRVAPEEPEYE